MLVSDSGKYFRPRAYKHRHKLHKMPAFLSRHGSRELYDIADELLLLVIDDKDEGMKKYFVKKHVLLLITILYAIRFFTGLGYKD